MQMEDVQWYDKDELRAAVQMYDNAAAQSASAGGAGGGGGEGEGVAEAPMSVAQLQVGAGGGEGYSRYLLHLITIQFVGVL